MNYNWFIFYTDLIFLGTSTELSKSSVLAIFLQYQRRGIGELVLKDQRQLVLKYQQATPLESAGIPLWLGLIEHKF